MVEIREDLILNELNNLKKLNELLIRLQSVLQLANEMSPDKFNLWILFKHFFI